MESIRGGHEIVILIISGKTDGKESDYYCFDVSYVDACCYRGEKEVINYFFKFLMGFEVFGGK